MQLVDIAVQVARIKQAPQLVQQKLASGNFLGALQLLRHAHAQLQGQGVRGVACLSSMVGELEGVREAVHKMMGQEFLVVASGLFEGCMQRADAKPFNAPAPPALAKGGGEGGGGGVGEFVPSGDDRRLLLVIAGLLHSDAFAAVMQQWQKVCVCVDVGLCLCPFSDTPFTRVCVRVCVRWRCNSRT